MTTSSSQANGVDAAEQARKELYETLELLGERLDYAKRIDDAGAAAKAKVVEVKEEKPLAFYAGVAGIAVVAGLAVWGVTKKLIDLFD